MSVDILDLEAWQMIQTFVGQTIISIQVTVYVFKDAMDWDDTGLQISFGNGSTFYLRQAGDGQSLRVLSSAWIDDFREPLSQENRAFVASYGRWSLIDMSDTEPFNLLVGARVNSARPIIDQFNKLIGAQIVAGHQYLNFIVEWDECHILWGIDNPLLLERGYIVGNPV